MNNPPASLSDFPPAGHRANIPLEDTSFSRISLWLMLLGAVGVPVSLLWDFSWESTVGIDLIESPPHIATYLAVALTGAVSLVLLGVATWSSRGLDAGIRIGFMRAPSGIWLAAWGSIAYLTAFLFDQWWQSAYGLSAGIWHPPQILKAVAFFSIVIGTWLFSASRQNQDRRQSGCSAAFVIAGGVVLALISVVTLTWIYPNRQHSATFYKVGCGTYPVVLIALAMAGKFRWSATMAAGIYMLLFCTMVWLLPLFAATPQVPPIYNQMQHLMPPPFPLLLVVPALGLDLLFGKKLPFTFPAKRWQQAAVAAFILFVAFFVTQWTFAEFLLTDLADNWFFAGGGRHWPFFLKIDSMSRVSFWNSPQEEMNLFNSLVAAGLAMAAAYLGSWVGTWMKALQR